MLRILLATLISFGFALPSWSITVKESRARKDEPYIKAYIHGVAEGSDWLNSALNADFKSMMYCQTEERFGQDAWFRLLVEYVDKGKGFGDSTHVELLFRCLAAEVPVPVTGQFSVHCQHYVD